jgi:hypothetical protein
MTRLQSPDANFAPSPLAAAVVSEAVSLEPHAISTTAIPAVAVPAFINARRLSFSRKLSGARILSSCVMWFLLVVLL